MVDKILVVRAGALGDVILTTPIFRRIRKEHPTALIAVRTSYVDVFRGNPDVDAVNVQDGVSFNRIIDLNLVYERLPKMHIIDAYMMATFGDKGFVSDKSTSLTPLFEPESYMVSAHGAILIHAARSWQNRTLPDHVWIAVVAELNYNHKNRRIIFVGSTTDFGFEDTNNNIIDARGLTSLPVVAGMIHEAACFVGTDSGLLHVAGTTQTPIVGIFTSVRPEYRMPWRQGELGWRCYPVVPDIMCRGCLERCPAPATTCGCERGDYACVDGTTLPAHNIVLTVQRAMQADQSFG